MSGLLGIALGDPGSARARYGRAMALYQSGRLTPDQLEAYRIAAADDGRAPAEVFSDRGLRLPPEAGVGPSDLIGQLITEADRYLATLDGPGLAEVRAGIAAFRDGPIRAAPRANAVVAAHLSAALGQLSDDQPALAAAIAAAAPHLAWTTYTEYPAAEVGPNFARSHAYASLIGVEQASTIPADDFDMGLFLMSPHLLYRDHAHAAPELYAPLTGPHGWRFGPDRPLVPKPAHDPVWSPPHQPHLTKVGPVPFLCLYGWTCDAVAPARILPASDWPELEALRLG